MEEVVKDLYDEYIEDLRVFYKDQEAAFPRIPHSLLKEKEVVSTYIKDDLSDLVDCEYDQILHHLLKDSTKHHIFVRLFHDKDIFDFDYNVKDKAGNTLLMNFISAYFPQMVEKNRKLHWYYIVNLMNGGYQIQPEDEVFSVDFYEDIKDDYKKVKKWVKLRVLIKSKDLESYLLVEPNDRLCCLISLKKGKNIGIGFSNMLGTANLALTSYKESGDIMLRAIQFSGISQQLINEDKKGTFNRLRVEFLEDKPEQDKAFEALVLELFPKLKVEA